VTRVVVSLSSIPSRLALSEPAIASLLAQERPPDLVVVCLPRISVREGTGYELPAHLADADGRHGGRVQVRWTDTDWGPGTKLVGALDDVGDDAIVVLVDDDNEYRPFVVGDLADAVAADPSSAYSFYTRRLQGLEVGYGGDGLAVHGRHLRGLRSFADRVCADDAVRLHDDVWLSFFLRARGVPMRSLRTRLAAHGADLSYASVHDVNALVDIEGDLSRARLNETVLERLFELEPTPPAMRLRHLLHRAGTRSGLLRVGAGLGRRLRRHAGPAGQAPRSTSATSPTGSTSPAAAVESFRS
jgi:hypothetical protein